MVPLLLLLLSMVLHIGWVENVGWEGVLIS